jgi:hypothetical protein
LVQNTVNQGGLAVVNVCDDSYVSDTLHFMKIVFILKITDKDSKSFGLLKEVLKIIRGKATFS